MVTKKLLHVLSALAMLGGLLLAAPETAIAQAAPIDGIKVAPALSPFPATSEIPADIAAQLNEIDPNTGQPKGWAIAKVRADVDDVYYITDGNYQSLVIRHEHGLILVDAPEPLPFFGPMNVLAALASQFPGVPVTHMIYSHGHSDHIGGASAIKAAFPHVKIIAHKEIRKLLKTIKDPKRPVPRITFRRKKSLKIGDQRINLHYFGNTHQAGSIYIYLPKQKILMAVDVVYPGWVPFRRLALSENIRGWIKGHDAILKFNFKTLIPGHLTKLGTREDVKLAMQYNDEIAASIEAGYLDATTLFGAVGVIFGNGIDAFSTAAKWALFSAFYDSSTQRCVDALAASTSDWKGKLAGEETFNFSNCEAYFVARRLGGVAAHTP